jgi:hypothetical protein
MKDTNPYRRVGIVEANGQESIPGVENHGQIARRAIMIQAANRVVKKPGMSSAQGSLGRRFHSYGDPLSTRSKYT